MVSRAVFCQVAVYFRRLTGHHLLIERIDEVFDRSRFQLLLADRSLIAKPWLDDRAQALLTTDAELVVRRVAPHVVNVLDGVEAHALRAVRSLTILHHVLSVRLPNRLVVLVSHETRPSLMGVIHARH